MPAKIESKKALVDNPVLSEASEYERDHEDVRGKFHNYESPGNSLKFRYRKWKQDDIEEWEFKDGEIKSIPLMVAIHLRQSGKDKKYQHKLNSEGKQVQQEAIPFKRYSFEFLDFLPKEAYEHEESLVEVKRIG